MNFIDLNERKDTNAGHQGYPRIFAHSTSSYS